MGTKFDDGDFITMVKKHKCLYDKRDKHFRKQAADSVWIMISNTLNLPVDVCVQRWTNIRHRYAKERRKLRNQSPGYCGYSEWVHYDACSFLDDIIVPRRTTSHIFNSLSMREEKTLPALPQTIVKTEPVEDPLMDVEAERFSKQKNSFPSEISAFCRSESVSERITSSGNATISLDSTTTPSCLSDRTSTPSPCHEVEMKKQKIGDDQIQMPVSSVINQLGDYLTDSQDEDILFGRSIGLTLKKISSLKDRLTAKAKIMMVLSEIVDSD